MRLAQHLCMITFSATFLWLLCWWDEVLSYLCRFFCHYSHVVNLWFWPKFNIASLLRTGLKAFLDRHAGTGRVCGLCFSRKPTTCWCETHTGATCSNISACYKRSLNPRHLDGFWFVASFNLFLQFTQLTFSLSETILTLLPHLTFIELHPSVNTLTADASWHQLILFVTLFSSVDDYHHQKDD